MRRTGQAPYRRRPVNSALGPTDQQNCHHMPQVRRLCLSLLAGSCFASVALAAPCNSPAHRQFDFWLGEWNVHTPDGKLAGVNRIEREYEGCVLHERYTTDRGYKGESLNAYDAGRQVWHQTWVDNQGTVLLLEGKFQSGSMVLQGQTKAPDGKLTKHRITWTPAVDGSVRQHWQSTGAKGRWETSFDGRYTRR